MASPPSRKRRMPSSFLRTLCHASHCPVTPWASPSDWQTLNSPLTNTARMLSPPTHTHTRTRHPTNPARMQRALSKDGWIHDWDVQDGSSLNQEAAIKEPFDMTPHSKELCHPSTWRHLKEPSLPLMQFLRKPFIQSLFNISSPNRTGIWGAKGGKMDFAKKKKIIKLVIRLLFGDRIGTPAFPWSIKGTPNE